MAAGALKRAAPPAHGAFDELQRRKNSGELDLRIWSVASGIIPSSRMTSWPPAGAPTCLAIFWLQHPLHPYQQGSLHQPLRTTHNIVYYPYSWALSGDWARASLPSSPGAAKRRNERIATHRRECFDIFSIAITELSPLERNHSMKSRGCIGYVRVSC